MAESTQKKKAKFLSAEELSTFCAQVAMIIKSGITVHEGINIMMEDVTSERGRAVLTSIHEELEKGSSLGAAMDQADCFPYYVIHMTQIGEQTGNLENVMSELADYYEREQAISKNIKNAVTYPMIMVVMMLLVVGTLLIKVLPIFNDVFENLGGEMSGFSRAAMNFGKIINNSAVYILGVIAVIVVALLAFRFTKKGNELISKFRNFLLGGKKLQTRIASGRFASAMAMMLSSGLDTDDALDMVYKLIEDKMVKEKILVCKKAIGEGKSFSEALTEAKLFSGVYSRMIAVASKTGSMDTMMNKLARRYEEEVDDQINHMISILEPTLVVVLSVIVGMILLSVMLPLMGVMSSIG